MPETTLHAASTQRLMQPQSGDCGAAFDECVEVMNDHVTSDWDTADLDTAALSGEIFPDSIDSDKFILTCPPNSTNLTPGKEFPASAISMNLAVDSESVHELDHGLADESSLSQMACPSLTDSRDLPCRNSS